MEGPREDPAAVHQGHRLRVLVACIAMSLCQFPAFSLAGNAEPSEFRHLRTRREECPSRLSWTGGAAHFHTVLRFNGESALLSSIPKHKKERRCMMVARLRTRE